MREVGLGESLFVLISSPDLLLSCLGDLVFMILWGGCELAWREESSAPSGLYNLPSS